MCPPETHWRAMSVLRVRGYMDRGAARSTRGEHCIRTCRCAGESRDPQVAIRGLRRVWARERWPEGRDAGVHGVGVRQ